MMQALVPREANDERRVALTPDGVKELVGAGLKVCIEPGAGEGSHLSDSTYEASGAQLGAAISESDWLLKINPPTLGEIAQLKPGSISVSFLSPTQNREIIDALCQREVTAFAMDLMPRISRAQSMDALSSFSTIAGYRAALLCALHLPRFFPMLMTAAGTLPPARAFVIGAGVAGLQAIATCRRLGAIVEAFDVRPAVKEQIESLGGKFVGLSLVTDEAEDAGGYAKEVSTDTHTKELDLIAGRLQQVDCVISTALIPGKRAPTLITEEMVKKMRPGSVIVDLAATAGGNCECTVPGEIVSRYGVTVIGSTDMVMSMASDASKMYSKNITAFLGVILKEGNLNLDMEDEIVRGTLVTHGGKIVHESTRIALNSGGAS